MKVELEFPWTEEEFLAAMDAVTTSGKSDPLRALCQKELDNFASVVRQHPDYSDGLVKIECLAVAGYLFQKLRGHV